MSIFKRKTTASDSYMSWDKEPSYIAAARTAIGVFATRRMDAQDVADYLQGVFPTLSKLERARSTYAAVHAMLGMCVPEQFSYLQGDEPSSSPGDSSHVRSQRLEIQEVMADRDLLKAQIELVMLRSLYGRLHEGRYYNEAESRVSPIESCAILYQFGDALQVERDDGLAPYRSDSLLGVTKETVFDAMKVAYIHRHEDSTFVKLLKDSVPLLAHFVEEERYDQALAERALVSHAMDSNTYCEFVQHSADEMERLISEWEEYTAGIDQILASIA